MYPSQSTFNSSDLPSYFTFPTRSSTIVGLQYIVVSHQLDNLNASFVPLIDHINFPHFHARTPAISSFLRIRLRSIIDIYVVCDCLIELAQAFVSTEAEASQVDTHVLVGLKKLRKRT